VPTNSKLLGAKRLTDAHDLLFTNIIYVLKEILLGLYYNIYIKVKFVGTHSGYNL
jgi:hypothetical protein